MDFRLIARFLSFVYYIMRICNKGCFREYSRFNLLGELSQLLSFQSCPQEYFMIALIFNSTSKIGFCRYWHCHWYCCDLMNELSNHVCLTIYFSDRSEYYKTCFFPEKDAPSITLCLFIYLFIYFFTLLLIFKISYSSVPLNHVFLNDFPLLSRHELLLFEHVLLCFNLYISLPYYQFWFSLSPSPPLIIKIFCLYCSCYYYFYHFHHQLLFYSFVAL